MLYHRGGGDGEGVRMAEAVRGGGGGQSRQRGVTH